jgi:hypothetical protein
MADVTRTKREATPEELNRLDLESRAQTLSGKKWSELSGEEKDLAMRIVAMRQGLVKL